ncbi:MAG: PASTA domain-containing protein, partial [Actinomycetes bacterium]
TGSALAPGSSVTIYLSTGPAPVIVPDLSGKSGPDAVKALTDVSLSPNILGTGMKVVAQDVPPGTSVAAGTTITVTLG